MDRKRIKYNGVKLEFLEDNENYKSFVVMATLDNEKQLIVDVVKRDENFCVVEFVGYSGTSTFTCASIGDLDVPDVVALMQCYFLSKHEQLIGDLRCVDVKWGCEKHSFVFERDPLYDQPILIFLDRLQPTVGINHGN